jgi:hypothetical protein
MFTRVDLLLQDLLDCPPAVRTLDFSGGLDGVLVLLFVFDARLVMRQRAQTMICVMVLNQKKLRHSPWRVVPGGLTEGQDSMALLLAHDDKSGFTQTLFDLQRGTGTTTLEYEGKRLAVHV